MQDFKKLKVWIAAHELNIEIYRITKMFPKEELYGITQQLRRASVSIAANVVEGCGKKTSADFAKFLNISLGSANETEYYIILTRDLGILSVEDFDSLSIRINSIKAMLINLITRVRNATNVKPKT